ncbi:hypothetical protein Ate01nite_63900 [Actinoplanes teichomyceticus]|nr:hypothetical protein Ate01nite_63900 [Actinoplanes teichomyceticus]
MPARPGGHRIPVSAKATPRRIAIGSGNGGPREIGAGARRIGRTRAHGPGRGRLGARRALPTCGVTVPGREGG